MYPPFHILQALFKICPADTIPTCCCRNPEFNEAQTTKRNNYRRKVAAAKAGKSVAEASGTSAATADATATGSKSTEDPDASTATAATATAFADGARVRPLARVGAGVAS